MNGQIPFQNTIPDLNALSNQINQLMNVSANQGYGTGTSIGTGIGTGYGTGTNTGTSTGTYGQTPNKITRVEGLDENSKRVHVSNNPFKLKLKTHQEALLYRALELDEKAPKTPLPFAVMSDKTGSGKTFVILALIYYSITQFNSKGVNIIVVPHSIYSQWIISIDNFLGKLLKYVCLTEYSQIQQLYSDKSILHTNHIIITTPLIYDSFASTVNSLNVYVRRVIFDEADTMKNLLAYAINSQMTWFVSATISNVFDPITLKATIGKYDLYLPALLSNECYCKPEFIDAHIKLPKPNVEKFVCKNFYIDLVLVNILDEEQIKCINAHDYAKIRADCGNTGTKLKSNQDVLKNLYTHSHKMYIDACKVLEELTRNKTNAPDLKTKTMRKQQLFKQRIDKIKFYCLQFNLCIECFTHIPNETAYKLPYPCLDCVCLKCLSADNKITCLTCDKIHKLDSLTEEHIVQHKKTFEYLEKSQYDKLWVLENILEACDDKIIIYSEFGGLNDYLKNYSIDMEVQIVELNGGNSRDVDKVLSEFKENPKVRIMLIDNVYFGVGLNIENTTDIIFFHNVDENTYKQLIGRAQRFGRKHKLNVWEIKYSNEDKGGDKNERVDGNRNGKSKKSKSRSRSKTSLGNE